MIYKKALVAKDIGRAVPGGIIAVILANTSAADLLPGIGKNLEV